jgi:DNA-binding transcriptional MocR family regulator
MRFDHPGEGGLFLWGELPEGVDIDLLVQDAMRNKILLVRGAAFFAEGNDDPHIRFNVAMCQAPAVADYLRERLGAVTAAQQALLRAVGQLR